jgi:predicted MPP superfamily phosphohydrolase
MRSKHHFEHNNHTNLAFLLSAVALQGLLTWLSFIAYEAWVAAFGPGWRILEFAFMIFSFSFLSATLIAVRSRHWWARAYYWLAAYWFACIGPLFGAAALFVIIEWLLSLAGIVAEPFWAGIFSFSVAIVVIIYGLWQAQRVGVTRITVAMPNLPPQWKGKVVAFVADTHLGDVRGVRFSEKVARKLAALHSEAILIGGDFFDGFKCDAEKLAAPFAALKPPRGIYFVTGNHDFYSDREYFLSALRGAGVHILDNAMVNLDGLQLAGVDFNDSSWRENFENAIENIQLDPSRPSVLLKHVPEHLDIAEQKGFSLTLSGHTHHGQLWPLSYITRYIFKGYDYGLKKFGRMMVYTTSGAGTWALPFRLFTKSEIVAITLESK